MSHDRREVLSLLGMGGLTGLSGCSRIAEYFQSSDSQPPKPTFDSTPRVEAALEKRTPRRPGYEFSYDAVSIDVMDSELFSEIRARPSTFGQGDYLQIRPANRSAQDLAELLRAIWKVGIETTINNPDITFRGGEAFGTAYLVGTARLDGAVVAVVRSRDLETAKSLAEDATFPLEIPA